MKPTDAELVDLLNIFWQLGPRARSILLEIARRLDKGREYGDFTDPRDWKKEGKEELLDFVVYEIAERVTAHDTIKEMPAIIAGPTGLAHARDCAVVGGSEPCNCPMTMLAGDR